MNLQKIVTYLLQNGYMVTEKGKYKVTAKFNKEMTGQEMGLAYIGTKPAVIGQLPAKVPAQQMDWQQRYIEFLKEAQIPARGEGNNGSYDLNKYSEDGMKAFRKALEKEGVQYPVLVKSTLLYYKTHRKFAHTISNYMSRGLWKSDYQALLESAEEGNIEGHIQTQIDNDREFSRFKLG